MRARQRRAFRAGLCLAFARFAGLAAGLAAVLAALVSSELGFAASGLAASAFASGLASSFFAPASSLSAPCRLRLFSLSDLKSVSYQPEPLRRKTGAEMSFFSPFL